MDKSNLKKAVVIGATGLIGSHLVKQLLADNRFAEVVVFVRRATGIKDTKLKEYVIDFKKPDEWSGKVKGDVFFSVLGTTLKQAGSKESEYKVDYTYQYLFAQAADENKIPAYILVSSAGANEKSRIFYTRMKGELDRDVQKLNFSSIHIIRPGLLAGKREKKRKAEKVYYIILNFLVKFGIFTGYRPVLAKNVAKLMIYYSFMDGRGIHESDEMHKVLLSLKII